MLLTSVHASALLSAIECHQIITLSPLARIYRGHAYQLIITKKECSRDEFAVHAKITISNADFIFEFCESGVWWNVILQVMSENKLIIFRRCC